MNGYKITRHCLCGGSMVGSASPLAAAEALCEAFNRFHSGEGHGPVTAKQAANARRRENRARVNEYAAKWDDYMAAKILAGSTGGQP